MGLLNQINGAVVAEEALEKLDPEAGFLKKGMAIIGGFDVGNTVSIPLHRHRSRESGNAQLAIQHRQRRAGRRVQPHYAAANQEQHQYQ